MSKIQTNELGTVDGTKTVQVADIADGNVGLGVGQTWQDVTSQRQKDVEYTNDTGRTIIVRLRPQNAGDDGGHFIIDGTIDMVFYVSGAAGSEIYIIPPGSTYEYTGTGTINQWHELR